MDCGVREVVGGFALERVMLTWANWWRRHVRRGPGARLTRWPNWKTDLSSRPMSRPLLAVADIFTGEPADELAPEPVVRAGLVRVHTGGDTRDTWYRR